MTDDDWLVDTEWSIPSEYGQEKLISAKLTKLLAELRLFASRISDMCTAVTEACLNALEHGNKLDKCQRVRVRVRIAATRAIYRILDGGDGFDYASWDKSLLDETVVASKLDEDDPRGWGMKLILTLADEVRFGREKRDFYTEMEFVQSKVQFRT
ncbi:MAG: hypothetical protein K0Q59_2785 [Paenibacillus sp.]|jgi:anti-sigma regulatory factor (Ser/Thr protein kinase)|nr:hypothetical protein [Paenibacillus sp.]